MNLKTTIRNVLIASLAALPSSLLFFAYEGSVIRGVGWLGASFWTVLVAAIGCIIFGLPIHELFKRRKQKKRLVYVITGFLIPVLLMASGPMIFQDWQELFNQDNIKFTLVLATAGAAVALAFRELTVNPD